MKVLVTGHDGYIGSVMVPVLQAAGHEVIGMDTRFFSDDPTIPPGNILLDYRQDIREAVDGVFKGIEAVIHLAALSNDPLGELNPELTFEINHRASLRLARMAKSAGVQRFLYASTCSIYGVSDHAELATEETRLEPLTPYARSKLLVEADLAELADESFSLVYLRNATAFGWSPRFRSDLVLNNLACWAYATGEIRILSDGTPWRPVVHVRDIANAFAAALSAPRDAIHNQAFNVGLNDENYQVRQLAEIVQQAFPDARITYNAQANPDQRSYRVNFSKILHHLPGFMPVWDTYRGVEELRREFKQVQLTRDDFTGPKYVRLARIKALLRQGLLDEKLYWKDLATNPKESPVR